MVKAQVMVMVKAKVMAMAMEKVHIYCLREYILLDSWYIWWSLIYIRDMVMNKTYKLYWLEIELDLVCIDLNTITLFVLKSMELEFDSKAMK